MSARLCISGKSIITGAPAVECKLVVGIIVQLTRREAIILVFVILFIWLTGYLTGAKVTRISEKTKVKFNCIFLPAPEDSDRV